MFRIALREGVRIDRERLVSLGKRRRVSHVEGLFLKLGREGVLSRYVFGSLSAVPGVSPSGVTKRTESAAHRCTRQRAAHSGFPHSFHRIDGGIGTPKLLLHQVVFGSTLRGFFQNTFGKSLFPDIFPKGLSPFTTNELAEHGTWPRRKRGCGGTSLQTNRKGNVIRQSFAGGIGIARLFKIGLIFRGLLQFGTGHSHHGVINILRILRPCHGTLTERTANTPCKTTRHAEPDQVSGNNRPAAHADNHRGQRLRRHASDFARKTIPSVTKRHIPVFVFREKLCLVGQLLIGGKHISVCLGKILIILACIP